MGFFGYIKAHSLENRLNDELQYSKVAQELASGITREGLMAKAIADSGGDIEKSRALYIKYRVKSMRDEDTLSAAYSEHEATLQREARASSKHNYDTTQEENLNTYQLPLPILIGIAIVCFLVLIFDIIKTQ